ncbi:MAG TPA: ATP-dependent DNA helicase, partial [Kiloniellales bacterium]|nr:ATP-dependent DNA helicase [Kiloniellales bacterium]
MSSPTASGRRDGPAPAPAAAPRQSSTAPADLPVLVVGLSESLWLDPVAGPVSLPSAEAARRARRTPPLVCHARASARRLGCDPFPAYDLLELFAFVRPAAFCTPTPRGLTSALGMPAPVDPETAAASLRTAAETLLREVAGARRDSDAGTIARVMAGVGWRWGPVVLARLAPDGEAPGAGRRGGLDVWERLPAWSEQAPPGPPGQEPVSPAEARGRLAELLGEEAEARPQQADYASAVSQAFLPRAAPQTPRLLLAEAGTGVGKTLGYLASASLWAEKNEAPVWISTFTRNLQ